MKTPEEKYLNDPHYNRLVDYMLNMIIQADFTPSELREAVIFAHIKYEMQLTNRHLKINKEVGKAIETLDREFLKKKMEDF